MGIRRRLYGFWGQRKRSKGPSKPQLSTYVPHPPTPEQRSKSAKKAWETRKRREKKAQQELELVYKLVEQNQAEEIQKFLEEVNAELAWRPLYLSRPCPKWLQKRYSHLSSIKEVLEKALAE
jgi:hypothetical protein